MNRSSMYLLIIAAMLLVSVLRLLPYWDPRKYFRPKVTGSGNVLSRRIEYHHGWDHYITVSLGGMELELKASEQAYHDLTEGSPVQLVWRDQELLEYTIQ